MVQDQCNSIRCQDVVWGTPLVEHQDPMRATGAVHTGRATCMDECKDTLDVNGDGSIDHKDFHDACFLSYPVPHQPHPAHSRQDFIDFNMRNQAIVALQDFTDGGQLDESAFETKVQEIALRSGIDPDELRKLAHEIFDFGPPPVLTNFVGEVHADKDDNGRLLSGNLGALEPHELENQKTTQL